MGLPPATAPTPGGAPGGNWLQQIMQMLMQRQQANPGVQGFMADAGPGMTQMLGPLMALMQRPPR